MIKTDARLSDACWLEGLLWMEVNKTMMKIENMVTKQQVTRLSLVSLAVTLGLSATAGCDTEEEREENLVDHQTLGDLTRSPRDFAQHQDDSAERIQHKLAHDESFTRPIFYLAHYLGYAWVGGNGGQYVGEDMTIQESAGTIVFKGNGSGSCDGYRCGDKTKITLSNFHYELNGDSFQQGTVTVIPASDEDALVLTGTVVNLSDQEQTFVGHIQKNMEQNWSKSDSHSVGLSVTYSEKVTFPLAEASLTVAADTSRTWGETNGGSESTQVLAQVRAVVPPRAVMPFTVSLQKSSISYPYSFKAQLSYDVTMEGFLRWGGNAWHDHPTNRPNHSYTYVAGRETDVATNLNIQWGDRDLGYVKNSLWDWEWAIDEFGLDNVEWAAAESIRPTLVDVKGVFTAESAWAGDAIFGKVTYIDDLPDAEKPSEDGIHGDGEEWEEGDGE